MPRYSKGKGKLQRKRKWKGFTSVSHITKWLTKTPHDHPIWKKHFKEAAKNYKREKPFFHARTLRKVANKAPVKLAGDVLSELKRYRRGKNVGGGISELLHWLSNEAAQATGFNSFKEFIGQGYEHKKIPREAQVFAKAVDATFRCEQEAYGSGRIKAINRIRQSPVFGVVGAKWAVPRKYTWYQGKLARCGARRGDCRRCENEQP